MPDKAARIPGEDASLVRLDGTDAPVFTPGETYISIVIRRISLKHGRGGLRKYGPYVYGVLGQTSFDEPIELAGVFSPAREEDIFAGASLVPGSQVGAPVGQVEVRPGLGPMQAESFRRLDPMVLVDRQLTPRMVYHGAGPIEIGFGAVQQKDPLADTLGLIEEVVKSPVAQFVSAIVPPLGALAGADLTGTVRRLFGRLEHEKGTERLAVISTNLSELMGGDGQLHAGTYALIAGRGQAAGLQFDEKRKTIVDAQGREFVDAPYVAFDLQCETTRPDWGSVPDVNSAWRALEAEATDGDPAQALEAFRRAVYLSPDLVPEDGRRLQKAARRKISPLLSGAEFFHIPKLGRIGEALKSTYDEVMASEVGRARDEWDRFHRCHEVMRINEGGYVDHPDDPGGATNKGVTQRTYEAWRRRQGLPARHVRDISEPEVLQIYFEGYWRAGHCHRMPGDAAALVLFDACVNHGLRPAMKFIQRGAGLPPREVDGLFGPRTLRAVQSSDPTLLIQRALDARWHFFEKIMRRNPRLESFRGGWRARVDRMRGVARSWLTGQESAVAPLPVLKPEGITPPVLRGISGASAAAGEPGE
ncbi:MAG: hypothetical protein GVY06_09040 [Alphaproteobacteria bacterium]|nr:hypothetical protein [Alphaproteobacteria bacterium]